MIHIKIFILILDGGLGLQRCMAENLGEELEENYQIEEIEKIIFVANENMKNQSHPACEPIQPVDKTLWVSLKSPISTLFRSNLGSMIFRRSVVICCGHEWSLGPRLSDFNSEYLITSVFFKMVIGFFGFLTVVGFTIMVFYKRCVRLLQIYFLLSIFYRKMKMDSQLQREKRLNSSSFHQQCLIEENIKTGSYQRDSRTDSYWKISLPIIFSMMTYFNKLYLSNCNSSSLLFRHESFQENGETGRSFYFRARELSHLSSRLCNFRHEEHHWKLFRCMWESFMCFLSFQNLLTLL